MALFTDGPASTIEDLAGYDSQLLQVASTESIDVTRKLALAHEELGLQLESRLGGDGDETGVTIRPVGLSNIVTTPALTLWHAYRTLYLVYSDAYNSQLNDRYAGKRDQFRNMAAWAHEKLIQNGLGMAWDPVPRASTPAVTDCPGTLPNGTYYLTGAWLNGSGEEGLCGSPTMMTSIQGGLLIRLMDAPPRAAGWNVYVGRGPEDMTLQNTAVIPVDETWILAGEPGTFGRRPGKGQNQNFLLPIPRRLRRG